MDIKKVNVIKSKLSGGEGYDHFSPTQLTQPIAKYIIDYVMVNQEERRKSVKGYKLHFGSSVNNVAQKCVAKYAPLINQAAIFTTSEKSFHGHPEPLESPADAGRKSLALYYYTEEPDPGALRATKFQARPSDWFRVKFLISFDLNSQINILLFSKVIFELNFL